MIKKLLFAVALAIGVNASAQNICTDSQGTIIPDIAVNTLPSTGGFYEFQATTGCTYTFSHCSNGGSYTGDTYLIVTDIADVWQAGNDDFCGLGSQVSWTATYTGTARIHLGVCCGGTGTCSGGPTRVLAYWSDCAACVGADPVTAIDPSPLCNSGDFVLNATSVDSVTWFPTNNTAGAPLMGGYTYNTGTISTTTSYWVAAWDATNMCYGAPVEVIAEIQVPQTITLVSDTAYCDNGDSVSVVFTPTGGTVTGTGISGSYFHPQVAGIGNHWIYYDLGDACMSNDSAEFSVVVGTTDPTVYACTDSVVTVNGSMFGIGWFPSASSNVLLDTGITYDHTLTNSTTLYYGDLPASFYIDTITATNVSASDHNPTSGDDRGGIAISSNYFYYVGDNNTARIDLDFTGPWASFPRRDGIFSDLQTGQLYTLYDGASDPTGTYLGTDYTITQIVPMDEDLNLLTGSAVTLSTPIVVNNYVNNDFGMFAGQGMLVIWNSSDNNFYQIDVNTGNVTVAGTGTLNAYQTENIAFWGVAEIYNGSLSVSYRSNFGSYIERYVISTGTTMTVANFPSGISDLACFTIDPNTDRFYFHHEGSTTTFGGGSETGGFSDLVIFQAASGGSACRTAVPVMVSMPAIDLGADTTICSNDPLTLDAGPWDTFMWSTAETSQSISVATAATYYVDATDSLGCPNSDTIVVDVNIVTEVDLGSDVTVCNYQLVVLNAGGGYASYSWDNGETTQLIYVGTDTLSIGNNTITVTCIDNNGCTTTDNMDIIVQDCAGLEESEMVLLAYPNPVQDELNIQLVNATDETQMMILDINGKVVSNISNVTNDLMKIDMSSYSDGVYFVRVINGDYYQDIKVVKK